MDRAACVRFLCVWSARGGARRAGGRATKKMLRSGGPLFEDDEELSLLPRGNLSRRRSGGGGCCQLCRRACVCTVRLGLFCAAAACAVAVALLYIGPRSGTRSKVHTLEAEVPSNDEDIEQSKPSSVPGPQKASKPSRPRNGQAKVSPAPAAVRSASVRAAFPRNHCFAVI